MRSLLPGPFRVTIQPMKPVNLRVSSRPTGFDVMFLSIKENGLAPLRAAAGAAVLARLALVPSRCLS
jgi:hypothetical protein